MSDLKKGLEAGTYRICLLVVSSLTFLQIVHFLCNSLKMRHFVREWCFAQFDIADLEVTRLNDQSHSRVGLNESKSDASTKKIKVKYPLFLTKQNGNMFRRAQREDVKNQSSARNAVTTKHMVANDQTKSAIFGSKSNTPANSSRTGKKNAFESNSAIVITEGDRDKIQQYVAKERVDEPLSSARYKYTITQGDQDKEETEPNPEQKIPTIPQLPDDALDDDSLCTICYSQKSNTVLLDCGHGGICIDCATDTMKKNNHCLFCRARVIQIIEIETSEIKRGLYKVINSFYVSDGTYP